MKAIHILGRRFASISLAVLLLVSGCDTGTILSPEMPHVESLSLAEAREALANTGMSLEIRVEGSQDAEDDARVVDQEPASGTPLTGSQVVILRVDSQP